MVSNKICKGSVGRNIHGRCSSIAVLLAGVSSLVAPHAWAIDIANQVDWNNAVAAVAAASANSTVTINVTNGFALSSSLATIQAGNANVTVNITGNNQTIDGASSFQGIQISGTNAPTVNISGLAITNTAAIGGSGLSGQSGYYSGGLAYGSGGGGGGGLGAGGGLFVGSGANVTLSSVTFTGTTATGGAGGNGGSAQNASSSPTGGNGGDGGAANNGGAPGGGGAGGLGGNTGTQGTVGSAGSALGDGGGGGGGSGTTNSNTYTQNNGGGSGNANGGNGGTGGDGATNASGSGGPGPGSDGGAGGSGGAANGGAIYVATGATLTILDTAISGAAVTGGAAGTPGFGIGPSAINGFSAATGAAQGAGIYLSGVQANIAVSSGSLTYANTIGGTGLVSGGVNTALNKTGAGTLVLSGVNTFTGNVNIAAGILSVNATNNLGNLANDILMADGSTFAVTGTTTFTNGRDFKIAGGSTFDIASSTTSTIQGVVSNNVLAGNLIKAGNGTLVLSGANTYSGTTSVNGGTLRAGSANAFGSSNSFSVASGAILDLNGFNKTFNTLSGAGAVMGAASTISGALSPGDGAAGSSMAVNGNLTFQQGAQLAVQVSPITSSLVNVTGTATLGGATVSATYANGNYAAKQYTILTASNGLGGTTFGAITNVNLPSGFTSNLTYDANNAYLNLALNIAAGINVNQQNVSNTLSNYFNLNGGIPFIFGSLTSAGLTQISGELGTSSQQSTFDAMNLFIGAMMDPFIYGRSNIPARSSESDGGADAMSLSYEGRWKSWASGFGGTQATNGNATIGSNNVNRRLGAVMGGADYRLSPDLVAGFALAGGGTSFRVSNGLGSGRSDFFQAGAFLSRSFDNAYVTGALAYSWQDITTERTVAAGGADKLRAEFIGNAFSGRIESGYRFVKSAMGITPYVAGQFSVFLLPSYNEQSVVGANTFALAYSAKNVSDTLTEIGVRLDRSFALQDGLFTLRGRAAWVHDYTVNRDVSATFLTLPGATFSVNGAKAAQNAALATASAEWKSRNGFSLAGTLEGLFSSTSKSYAAKIVAGYQW